MKQSPTKTNSHERRSDQPDHPETYFSAIAKVDCQTIRRQTDSAQFDSFRFSAGGLFNF
jgi:hypothetical protein